MEDDEEIHSHQSIGSRSGSPDSPPANRRISVTVASAAPSQNTLTLALPFQQPKTGGSGVAGGSGGGGGGGGGREDCWSEGATAILIDAWGERYLELSRGNLKQKHWKEVADIVSSRVDYLKVPKTDIQCKNRIDTVKKKYKLEKAKIAAGGGPSTWNFYERLDHLIGPTAASKSGGSGSKSGGVSSLNTPPLRNVPVGIPVGVRSAPVQSLRLKQQQERQQQQQLQQFQLLQQQKQLQMQQQQQHQQQQQQKQLQLQLQQQQRKRLPPPPAYSDSESEQEVTPDSPESDPYAQKRARLPFNSRQQQEKGKGSKDNNWGDSVKELTRAISKFGEAYEQAESLKLQQMVEMQKQSMKFAKELELQRMQFFMKMQLELSQLKQTKRAGGVGNNNNNHHSSLNHNHLNSNHNNISNNNHSDDSNN